MQKFFEKGSQENYMIMRQMLKREDWKQSWKENGIDLSEESVERDFQIAKQWFLKHPTFIDPGIQHLIR